MDEKYKEIIDEEEAIAYAKKHKAYVYASWDKKAMRLKHIITKKPQGLAPETWRIF